MIGLNFSIPKACVGALALCSRSSTASDIQPIEANSSRINSSMSNTMSSVNGKCDSLENVSKRPHFLRVMNTDFLLRYNELSKAGHPLFSKDGKDGEIDITIALFAALNNVDELSSLALSTVEREFEGRGPIEIVVFHQLVDAPCSDKSKAMFSEMRARGVKAILSPDSGSDHFPVNCGGVIASKRLNI